MGDGVGDHFQQETKYDRHRMTGGGQDLARKPETYKRYGKVPKLKLPPPRLEGGLPLWESLAQRRSVRRYSGPPLTIGELSQLLWATQGVTAKINQFALRTAPSAGALYPVETYLVLNEVERVKSGLYHYEVGVHQLAQLKEGNLGRLVAAASLGQSMLERADAVFVWSAVLPRAKWKYKQRAYRYIYMDAGHIAQNLALAAVSLGLGTCQVGAFFDGEMNQLLELDGENETVIYLSAVGRLPADS